MKPCDKDMDLQDDYVEKYVMVFCHVVNVI